MKKRTYLYLITLILTIFAASVAGIRAQEASPETTPEATESLSIDCEPLGPGVTLAFYVGQGDGYFAQGNYTRAIATYTCAIEADPNYDPAYVNRGYAHAAQANYPAALEDYNRALELNPDSVTAYTNRGLLYTVQGSFAPALADFDLALALDANYAVAYLDRGVIHAAEGNYDLALTDFNQALTLDPTLAEVHAAIGAVYLAQALESYDQYQTIAGQGRAVYPPGGYPDDMLSALDDAFAAGTFTPWLPLQVPAR